MTDSLASWRNTATTQAIVDFVEAAARDVPPEERVATFDNDGTLWSTRPAPSRRSSERGSATGPS